MMRAERRRTWSTGEVAAIVERSRWAIHHAITAGDLRPARGANGFYRFGLRDIRKAMELYGVSPQTAKANWQRHRRRRRVGRRPGGADPGRVR